MIKNQDLSLVKEGETSFFVYNSNISQKGPGSITKPAFYNPVMELNRDLSILICQYLINEKEKTVEICDGLSASGARGIRFCNELTGDFEVFLNDWSKNSYNLIKKNIKNTNASNVKIFMKDLNVLLSEKRFDYIDVDPFGSPAGFIDSALRSIRNNGIIACTATDTTALCGVYPKVCIRRYGAKPCHSSCMKETAVRILLGFIAREAAKYDKSVVPILSYSSDHYFRVYVKIIKGAKKANKSVEKLDVVSSEICFFSKKNKECFGPMWLGNLHDKKTLMALREILSKKNLNTKNRVYQMLDLMEAEAVLPAFFYNVDEISSVLKTTAPKIRIILDDLKKKGFEAYRTHFDVNGFKTDASKNDIKKVFLVD
jgi:tRNA (guanine26-N2/guanine27-N2)-dimethyltransferase